MNNKGFTLVELLAVIAILAILVIVAMPNVLGMFNEAKLNTFVTEVQTIMSQAQTDFLTESFKYQGKEIVFFNNTKETVVSKQKYNELELSGGKKNYYIKISRNGEFEKVLVWDNNFCYDSGYTKISKENVNAKYVKESSSSDGATWNGNYINGQYTNSTMFSLSGCDGILNGVLYGDVNFDGDVNDEDATLILSHTAGLNLLDGKALMVADCNLDGVANARDARLVLRYANGLLGYETLPIYDDSEE